MTTSRFEGSRPIIRPFHGISPKIHASAWIAPGAVVVGDVEIGPDSSVWYASVLRGDVHSIRIGARSNLQDHCVVHVTRGRYCCEVGDEVSESMEGMGVSTHIQLQSRHRRRRDPSGAELGTREFLAIEHCYAASGLHELARNCGSCRPATDDQDIVVLHPSR